MTLELVAASGVAGVLGVGVAEGVDGAVSDGVEVAVELGVVVELGAAVELGVAVELGATVELGVTVKLEVAVATGGALLPLPPQPARSPPPIARAIERATPRCADFDALLGHGTSAVGDAAWQA